MEMPHTITGSKETQKAPPWLPIKSGVPTPLLMASIVESEEASAEGLRQRRKFDRLRKEKLMKKGM